MTTDNAVNKLFHTLYFKELSEGDEFIQSLWKQIAPSTMKMLQTIGIDDCKGVGDKYKYKYIINISLI